MIQTNTMDNKTIERERHKFLRQGRKSKSTNKEKNSRHYARKRMKTKSTHIDNLVNDKDIKKHKKKHLNLSIDH